MAELKNATYSTQQQVAAGETNSYANCIFDASTTAANGGALSVAATGRAIVSGSTFSNNSTDAAGNLGGAVWIEGYKSAAPEKQRSTVSKSLFTGNFSTGNGGAIYIASSNYMLLQDVTFQGNTSLGYGGAMYVCARGLVSNSNNITITGNLGDVGGGAYFYSTSHFYNTWTITGNTSSRSGGGFAAGSGTLTIHANAVMTITGNTSGKHGGGIYDNYIFKMYESADLTVADNVAANNGGGVYFEYTAKGTVSTEYTVYNAKITNNTAGGNGGGLYASVLKTSAAAATVTAGVNIGGSTFSGNVATCGGGLYNAGTMSIENSIISGNYATCGGGLYNSKEMTVSGSTVTGNDGGTAGGILNNGSMTIENSIISGNYATCGSALYAGSAAVTTITGSTISGNNALNNGTIFSDGGTLTITDSLLTGNSIQAANGAQGTVLNLGSSKLTMTGSTISDNTGHRTIMSSGASMTISDSLFQNNLSNYSTGNWGGAFAVVATSKTAEKTTVSFTNTDFIGNTAYNELIAKNCRGGAISYYRYNSELNLTNCNFISNFAGYGGAIALTSATNSTAIITDSLFADNTAVFTNGGAIYAESGYTSQISGSTFSGNYSGKTGGAVYSNGTASITDSVFSGNTADQAGAVYNSNEMTISGSTFTGNNGGTYGAVINNGSLTIENSIFAGNKSLETSGGAIYSNKQLTVTGSTFTGNSAASYGGAIIFTGTATIENCVFDGNYSPNGAIRVAGSKHTLTLRNSKFLTSSDSINNSGTLILGGTNSFAAGIISAGTAKLESGAAVNFDNIQTISFANLFNFADNCAVNFNGETVKFTQAQDFSSVAVSISCDLSGTRNLYKVATSGTLAMTFAAEQTFTVYDTSTSTAYKVALGDTVINDYKLKYGVIDDVNTLYLVKDETFPDEEPSNKVTTAADTVYKKDGVYSLREAAVTYLAASGTTELSFDEAVNGKEIDFSGGVITISGDSNWTGNGAENTILKGSLTNSKGITFSASGITFHDKSRKGPGGVLYNNSGATAKFSNVVMNGYTATGTYNGGAVYNNGGTVTVENSVIINNAASNGSAIYSSASGIVDISGSTISGNAASGNSAVYVYGGSLTVTDSIFNGNVYTGNTGALGTVIYTRGAKFSMSGSTVSENIGHRTVYDNGSAEGDVSISKCLFLNNVSNYSTGNWGGGYSVVNTDAEIAAKQYNFTNVEFTGNTAYNEALMGDNCRGGAISFYRYNATINVENCNFDGNVAGFGGAVSMNSATNSTLIATGSTFSDNQALYTNGGAIYAAEGYAIQLDNCVFDGNVAAGQGGAIYSDGTVSIKDSAFLTSSDSIYALGGITLTGSNTFAAGVISGEVISLDGSAITLQAGASISVLTDEVQDLSKVGSITVEGTAPGSEGALVVYGNLTFGADQTFTIYGKSVKVGDSFTVGEDSYSLLYSAESKRLEIRFNAATSAAAGSITDDEACKTDDGYAAKWTDATTIDAPACAAGTDAIDNVYLQLDGLNVSSKSKAESMIFGGAQSGDRIGDNNIKLYSGTAGYVFGGGTAGTTDGGKVKVEVEGGVASQVFGGGMGNVTGEIEVNLLSGSVDTVNGGALNADTADIVVNLVGGTANTVNAGSRISSGTHSTGSVVLGVTQNFTINETGSLYGAGMVTSSEAKLSTGDVSIEVFGGDLGEATAGEGVFGAGLASNGEISANNVVIDLSSGSVGNIFGAGWAQQDGSASATSVTINISGDVTGGFIYGGGAHSHESSGDTSVANVAINVSNNSGFTAIFAGGQHDEKGNDSVTGDAVITVTGSFTEEAFTTNLFGEGYNSKNTVLGTSTLVLNSFTGAMENDIWEFDVITLSGKSVADLKDANLSSSKALDIVLDYTGRAKANASDLIAEFNNIAAVDVDFILKADADLTTAASWQLFSANNDTFGTDWTMDIIYEDGAAQAVKLGESVTLGDTEWTLSKVEADSVLKTSAITLTKVVK